MKKILLFLFLALPIALALPATDTATQPASDVETFLISSEADIAELGLPESCAFEGLGPDCLYKCNLCPPTAQRCSLVCTWVGNCHKDCVQHEVCRYGYKWSEKACRCLPDRS